MTDRARLRRFGEERSNALRRRLEELEPGLRILAADFLGLDAPIDLVGADERGRLVLALVAEPGGELEGVANALAQAEFFAPRLHDWKKLAPELPVNPEAGVRVLLLAPEFTSRVRAAARAAGTGRIELLHWCGSSRAGPPPERPDAPPPRPRTHSKPRSLFRTGLRDEDLGLVSEKPLGA